MNKELIEEVVENLKVSIKEGDFDSIPTYISDVYNYEMISDEDLCEILEIEFTELDELVSGDGSILKDRLKQLKLLVKQLTKIKNQYEQLYFADKK